MAADGPKLFCSHTLPASMYSAYTMSSFRDQEEAQKRMLKRDENIMWVCGVVGCLIGIYFGFKIGGIGGAIVFGVVGFVLGLLLMHILILIGLGLGVILVIGLIIVVLFLVIGGISSLWGVGRP